MPEEVQELMNHIADKFQDSMDVRPAFSISLPQASYISSLYKIWKSEQCKFIKF